MLDFFLENFLMNLYIPIKPTYRILIDDRDYWSKGFEDRADFRWGVMLVFSKLYQFDEISSQLRAMLDVQ